ncbi:hypothetical protein [Cupriavidus malaysiensis]|uniref:Lipoprotein n=1 Tax=Cupriavidus malaysiensis TaxID=367825 RepID=A0ABM6FGT3_9BURK|nr:hypothetical protein [Cupriavidus malaysiensis]AOZ11152.1 hypothetical protein BKK80_34930 [Cupriavidus malaysiensis]
MHSYIKHASSLFGIATLCSGCASAPPTHLTLSDPMHRVIELDAAFTESGTARRCAENMLKHSPVTEATDITTRVNTSGNDMIVDVTANLVLQPGMIGGPLPVAFRCTYRDGKMVKATWTGGLKGS